MMKRVINRLASIKIIVGIFSDVDVQKPDEKSIMTYIAQFLKAYPEMGSDKPMVSESVLKPTHPPHPPHPLTSPHPLYLSVLSMRGILLCQ